MKTKIVVTGGLGYIGSHTVVELQKAGYEVVIIDNLSNAKKGMLNRIKRINGILPVFYAVDVSDKEELQKVFSRERYFDVVIHFAAFKSVAESVKSPLKYFNNNIGSLLSLLSCMENYGCSNLLFSSSATVYGDPVELPLKETTDTRKALSAYGSTKQMGEDILEKAADSGLVNAISLRYFNPVGAHESALIGEWSLGTPANLMPIITQAAMGARDNFTIFGNDYPTPDGTCIRDYIHVTDLALAHVKSCERLLLLNMPFEIFNVGTGRGHSVLELISCFEEENKVKVNYSFGEKRPGDAAVLYADVTKANTVLSWKAQLNLSDMTRDVWRWEKALAKM